MIDQLSKSKKDQISVSVTGRAAMVLSVALVLAGCADKENQASNTLAGTEHVCSSCHGMAGRSVNPTFPNLAGQQEEYIKNQLTAFRDKTRADPHAHTYMWGMAARLDDATIGGLASFYASQQPASGEAQDSAEIAVGKKIFEEGISDRDVPACVVCHGEKAEGNDGIPRLAGQHRLYIEEQLKAFQINSRANEIMHDNSKNLTSSEISAVAAYLSAQ